MSPLPSAWSNSALSSQARQANEQKKEAAQRARDEVKPPGTNCPHAVVEDWSLRICAKLHRSRGHRLKQSRRLLSSSWRKPAKTVKVHAYRVIVWIM